MLSPAEVAPLKFTPTVRSLEFQAPAARIGWLHSEANKNGASFDLVIKDGLGRTRLERRNCKSDTKEFGELLNEPTLVGEKLTVEISNLKGADEVRLFLN